MAFVRLSVAVLLAIAGVAGPSAVAEGNRLLPFWAQSYPAGYVQTEPDYPAITRDCRVERRTQMHHGFRSAVEDRCRPVLHARD